MKIKLSYKFFTAFLLTSVISIVLMVASMHFYLTKSFIEYTNKRDAGILNELANKFTEEYQNGWSHLDEQAWKTLLHSSLLQYRLKNRSIKPPLFTKEFKHRRKRGPFDKITLFDAQKQTIFGNDSPFKKHTTKAIIIQEKTVGWIGIKKKNRLSKVSDIKFLKQQANAFYITGICVLLLTVLVAWWLAKHLLTPIQQLIEGTQALTSRKFDTKIVVHSTDELGQLANNFNMMSQTLQRYEQLRKQWLSDVSHELRTPLTIMRGEIEAMQDGIRDFNHDTLNSLHAEVQSISRIVDDLHQLSAMETNTLSFEKTAINPLIILQDILKIFKTRLDQHHIKIQNNLSLNKNSIIQGDADRLTQLFSNLLENTLRYVDSPGSLTINYKQTEGNLLINFIDSGPGVPKQSIEQLFDRFYRVEQSRNRAKGGSGLGLAICKNIVELHDGQITATNMPTNGLEIKITLPLFNQ